MDLADELYGDKKQGFDLAADLYGDEQKPTPVKLGREGFADAVRQTMGDSWLGKQAGAFALQGAKAVEGLMGRNDQLVSEAARVGAEEAPVGAIAADVAKFAPAALAATAAAPVALPALAAAGIGFLTQPGDVAKRATTGAIEGATGYGLGKAAQGLAWGAKKIGELGSLSLARKALEDIIGPQNMPEALRLARSAPGNISAEQALVDIGNPNIANLARITHGSSVESAAANAALQAEQRAARLAAMEGVTPNLGSVSLQREAAAAPLYKQAKTALVTMDAPMMQLFERMPPGTLEAAKNIARMENRPFVMGEFVPAQQVQTGVLDAAGKPFTTTVPAQYPKITGESLHYIKRALSDISNMADPARGIGRDSQAAARSVLDDFLTEVEQKIPVYGAARTTFAEKSVPVNQSKVLSAMTDKLQTPLTSESRSAFLNTMGTGEQALLKKSTGYPRYESGDLNKLLTPRQMQTAERVGGELQRDANLLMQRASEGSRAAVVDAIKQHGLFQRIPNLLSRPAMIVNAVTSQLEGRANAAMLRRLDTAMRSPSALADLLVTAPVEVRNATIKALYTLAESGTPAATGATLADLVQQQ